MTRFHSTLAIAATAALLSGSAGAAALQPAAGAQPLFSNVAASTSTLQRAAVRADAIAHAPAAGEMNAQAPQAAASTLTRAQVREATSQALSHGFHVRTGNAS